MRRLRHTSLALCLTLFPAFVPGARAVAPITVATAANVQYAMEELKADFGKATGIGVRSIYGASGKLTAQIRNGAPFDVFVSADMDYPDSLHAWGYAEARPRPYAYGKLVLWTIRDLDLARGTALLADSTLVKIALADPRRAPYGREAVGAMQGAGLYERLKGKLVYGESLGQVNQYILMGTVDVGFTAKSIVVAPDMRDKGRWAEVDSALYHPIAQGAVLCKHGTENHPASAAHFLAYLYSAPARAILSQYGYELP